MNPGTSHLHQAHLGQPQGQPSYAFFPNARDFSIVGGVFNDVHHHTEQGRTALDELLKPYISEAAMHDSLARYPPPLCHPRTREKVLKIITDWIDDSYPRQHILWLNGPAGAGKSAIAQTIAERYKSSRLAASFFFLRNALDRGVADRLFLTLAWQLAKSIPETRPYLESVLQIEPLLYAKSIDIQFNQLIEEVFKNLLRDRPGLRPERSLIIIDGVDECATEQGQKQFLTLIADALAHAGIPLRFLICSRPEVHIKESFNMENMRNVTRAIMLDEKFAPNDDIRRYLEDEFFRIFTKCNISSLPSNEDIHHLVNKASGQFIYASTVVKFIDDDDCNPREQLDIILKLRRVDSSSPYAQLDLLYIQILSQQPDIKLLRDIFALIIALSTPRSRFVCRRLRIREENLRLKLRRMHSLLKISNSNIATYHRSLHDFFQDKKRAGQYHIHPIRVALIRLPERARQFAKDAELEYLGMTLLYMLRIMMFPLFIIPGICCGIYQDDSYIWFGITFFFPLPTPPNSETSTSSAAIFAL